MRSFIILEVDHGGDTDALDRIIHKADDPVAKAVWGYSFNYAVAVDVPAHTPTPDEIAAILSA